MSTENEKRYRGKRTKTPINSEYTFPSLQERVLEAVDEDVFPLPWFNEAGGGGGDLPCYDTNVMGRFECSNNACSQAGWGSKRVAITIRGYHSNGYHAVVYGQRCKRCNQFGALTLNEQSYVDRVSYRVKKWAGVSMAPPVYNRGVSMRPHEERLCEGCRQGHCTQSTLN